MSSRSAVIIGGGITGVLVARELLLAGWRVTLAEAQHVGAGSSSRTAAGIRQQFTTPGTVRGMRYAVRWYRDFAAETEGNEPVIVQNGYLFLAGDDAAWQAAQTRVAAQHAAGLAEAEALDHAELLARFPWLAPDAVRGASWCPTDGFLRPHLIYNDGARRVRELGGTLLQGAPVVGCTLQGDRVVAVHTPKGKLEADLFIDCTNAWSPRLGALLGAEPLPIAPLKRYLWFLGRDGPIGPDAFAALPMIVCPDGTYVRPENRDTLLMGRKHDTPPQPAFTHEDQDTIEPQAAHDAGIDALPFQYWAGVAEVVPAFGELAGVQATTGGFYATTPDHNPFYGFDPRRPNLLRLVGFSGHGAMLAPFTALVARALADAGADLPTIGVDGHAVDLRCFHIGRDHADAEDMVI